MVGAAAVESDEDDEDGEEASETKSKPIERLGIDIQATPPGKRLKDELKVVEEQIKEESRRDKHED